MSNTFLAVNFWILIFTFIFVALYSQTIPDRYPKGHDLGHGCVAIELGGFPYKLCPLNP